MIKAVIMAGGEGTRLRPVTCFRPKPMVPVANRPVMEYIIDLLKKNGIIDIAVTLQYLPEKITDHFGDGSELGVNLEYFIEKAPLGTAGGVKKAAGFIDDVFVVISGDALTDINLTEVIEHHVRSGSAATLALKKVDMPLEYGIVVTDKNGFITRFLEKPGWGEVFSDTANTGIYVLSPETMEYVKKDQTFDFSKDLFPLLLKEKKPISGFVTNGYWCDIGDLSAYRQAHMDLLDGLVKADLSYRMIRRNVWVGEGCEIDDSVRIESPVVIGKNNKIGKDTVIGKYTVIGDNNVTGSGCIIHKAVIWDNCAIGGNVEVSGSVICNRVFIKDGCAMSEYSVIGDNTVIREHSIVRPGIKVWPDKIIDTGSEVNSNLIWGAGLSRKIFGNRGVTGEINTDLTPEHASRLGAAYGAVLGGKASAGISYDDSTAAEMMKLSFISGMLSSGIEVFDLGNLTLPVTRAAIRFYGFKGGLHVSTSADHPSKVFSDFLDSSGCNVDSATERKIENCFAREDFLRCNPSKIKKPIISYGFSDYYLRNIINSLKIKSLPFRIALNTQHGIGSRLIKELLTSVGCSVELMELRTFNARARISKYDLGVSLEDFTERMMLVDNKGRVITEDMFTILVSIILFKTFQGGTVVIPLSASHVIEKLAEGSNCRIIRSKSTSHELMKRIIDNAVQKELDTQFVLNFDALAGLVKILEFMAEKDLRLSDLSDMIPEFHMNRINVQCPWKSKGRVIRQIIQQHSNDKIETLEGVKIHKPNGWVLLLPDAQEPVFRIISEGYSEEFAEELSSIYAEKVKNIIKQDL